MGNQRRRIDDDAAWTDLGGMWSLSRGVTYLNHGSFGPSAKPVRDARHAWTERLESQPMDFFVRQLDAHLLFARERLGNWLGTSGDNLVFVENATFGMNIVAGSVSLKPGDEVLLSDHEYGAVERIWQRQCSRCGARLTTWTLPCPITSADAVVDSLRAAVTPRTRLLVVSHVTSPTAVILPVGAITRAAKELGLVVCVDGPHAPGMVDVNLDRIGCDYYAASCHKWLSAPFGSGFLYVHPRWQATVATNSLSWGRPANVNGRLQPPSWRDEFSWAGTRDPAAFLSVTSALDFLDEIGIEAVRARTHFLASYARKRIGAHTQHEALVPDSPEWYGSMISMPLPPGDAQALQQKLWDRHRIEVPIIEWHGRRLIRPSCYLYTQAADIDRLVGALTGLLAEERTCGAVG